MADTFAQIWRVRIIYPKENQYMPNTEPLRLQSWVQEFGEGRSFYTSLGHRDDIWSNDPVFRAHLLGGIRWALGLEDGDATPFGR